jgi:hypothetical protein
MYDQEHTDVLGRVFWENRDLCPGIHGRNYLYRSHNRQSPLRDLKQVGGSIEVVRSPYSIVNNGRTGLDRLP